MNLSVIIPTYNPNLDNLGRTLAALNNQTLPFDQWELIIIDNNSAFSLINQINIAWHPNASIISEPKQGLTWARLAGFSKARGEFIVMVDDDNILNNNYLEWAVKVFEENKHLGAAGGKSIPIFDHVPPEWLAGFHQCLAIRDLGNHEMLEHWTNTYPVWAPIGAGMVIRKQSLQVYIDKATSSNNVVKDRTGTSLSSGGDNDIVLEIIQAGWQVGYFPEMILTHVIPKQRWESSYLARLINNSNKSWVQVLAKHHINPWKAISPWTLLPRKAKAWFTYKAWKSDEHFIRWRGACGLFDGLAAVKNETA